MIKIETTNYYKAKSRVQTDIRAWLANDDRENFEDWCESQQYPDRFGFSEKNIKKIFEEFFPRLQIVNGQPQKKSVQ